MDGTSVEGGGVPRQGGILFDTLTVPPVSVLPRVLSRTGGRRDVFGDRNEGLLDVSFDPRTLFPGLSGVPWKDT